jgi:hypothetical protein
MSSLTRQITQEDIHMHVQALANVGIHLSVHAVLSRTHASDTASFPTTRVHNVYGFATRFSEGTMIKSVMGAELCSCTVVF